MIASRDASIDVFQVVYFPSHPKGKAVSNRFVKQPSDTLPDEEPPPCISRWPKPWILLKTDYSGRCNGRIQRRKIEVITQVKDNVSNSKIFLFLFI